MTTRASTSGERRQLMQRKLAELDEQIARAQAAREAIRHGLRCPHENITRCPNFNAGITARLAGQPLSRSHQQLHGQRFHEVPDSDGYRWGVTRRLPGGLRGAGDPIRRIASATPTTTRCAAGFHGRYVDRSASCSRPGNVSRKNG